MCVSLFAVALPPKSESSKGGNLVENWFSTNNYSTLDLWRVMKKVTTIYIMYIIHVT